MCLLDAPIVQYHVTLKIIGKVQGKDILRHVTGETELRCTSGPKLHDTNEFNK